MPWRWVRQFLSQCPAKTDYPFNRFATEVERQHDVLWRGRMGYRTFGEPSSQLHERHVASDFGTRTQDKLAAQG
jgi:hypothetical protein